MKPVALATRVWVQWAVAQAEDPWAEPHLPAPEVFQLLMSSRDLSAPESQVVEPPEMPRAIPQILPDWQEESPEELSLQKPS